MPWGLNLLWADLKLRQYRKLPPGACVFLEGQEGVIKSVYFHRRGIPLSQVAWSAGPPPAETGACIQSGARSKLKFVKRNGDGPILVTRHGMR